MKQFLLAAVLAMLLSACANNMSNQEWQTQVSGKIQQWQLEPIKSITTFNLNSWSSLGENYLIIWTTPFKPFLIELDFRCSGLSFANALVVNQTNPSALMARFDSVSTPDSPGFKCQIGKIYPLTKEQANELKDLDKAQSESN